MQKDEKKHWATNCRRREILMQLRDVSVCLGCCSSASHHTLMGLPDQQIVTWSSAVAYGCSLSSWPHNASWFFARRRGVPDMAGRLWLAGLVYERQGHAQMATWPIGCDLMSISFDFGHENRKQNLGFADEKHSFSILKMLKLSRESRLARWRTDPIYFESGRLTVIVS
jgi:hypothetical protein